MSFNNFSLLPKPKNASESREDVAGEGGNAADVMIDISEDVKTTVEDEASNVGKALTHLSPEERATRYDLIAHVGHGPDRLVQTQLSDLKPKYFSEESLLRPTVTQVAEETETARQALQVLVREKTARTQPKSFSATRATQMLRYNSKTGGERMVKMVEMPTDPLEPPKFHHKRIPRPPPSPPAPRLHSPPRKATAEEQKEWHVPPCISSWKNPKGYTVPLDKRLAADGKGLEEKGINSRVSDLAEALFLAEKHNREEVNLRAGVERKVQQQEARKRDEHLRLLAEKARDEARTLEGEIEYASRQEESLLGGRVDTGLGLTIREREQLRRDRTYDRERELRLSKMSQEQRSKVLQRESERDVSERIALGVVQPKGESTLFDQRLFDQTSGVAAGMGGGEDEMYDLYSQPLFSSSAVHMIYKPQTGTSRPDQGFAGTEAAVMKEGPVQFEKGAADPFGVDQFLSEAKRGKKTHHPKAE